MTFEKALSAGFIQATDYVEIWQAYLDYLRRRVDFKQGIEFTCIISFVEMFQLPKYLVMGLVM